MKKLFSTICAAALFALGIGAFAGCSGQPGGGGGGGGGGNKAVDSIRVTTKPTKTNYEVGESFSTEGMEVTAYYDDDSEAVVTNYTYEPNGPLAVTDEKITITFEGKTAKVTIKVFNPIDTIEIKTMPTLTNYGDGDDFDPTGLVLTVKYKDGTSAELTPEDKAVKASGTVKLGQEYFEVKVSDVTDKVVQVPITVSASLQPVYEKVEYKEVDGKPMIIITGTTGGTSKDQFQFNMQVNNSSWQVVKPAWDITFDGKGGFVATSDISEIATAQGANQTWFPHFGLSKYAGAGDSDTDIHVTSEDSPEFTCGGHKYTPVTNDKTFNMPGVIVDAPDDYVPPEPGNPNLTFAVAKVEYKEEGGKPTIIITGTTEAGAAKKDFQFNMQINGGSWNVYDQLPWSIEFDGTSFTMKCDISSLPDGTLFPHFGLSTSQGAGEGNTSCDIHVTTPDSPAFVSGGKSYTPVTNADTFDMPGVVISSVA